MTAGHAPPHLNRRQDLGSDEIAALADVLRTSVEGGASLGFLWPLSEDAALAFYRRVARQVQAGERAIVLASDARGILGSAQLVLDQPENQPHRADVCKVVVHPRARRRGVGAALMGAIEDVARREGRTLLVLDTLSGSDAERLYVRLGWRRVGEIPDYALTPHRALAPTTYFYRELTG